MSIKKKVIVSLLISHLASYLVSVVVLVFFFSPFSSKDFIEHFFYGEIFLFFFILISAFLIHLLLSIFVCGKVIGKKYDMLKELRKEVKILVDGNLDVRMTHFQDYEIEELSKNIDQMRNEIKHTQKGAERSIKHQTKNIQLQKEKLEEQQEVLLSLLRDVEEERDKVAFAKERTQAIIDSIGDGLFVVDWKGNIILFNPVARKISGFSEADVLGKRYDSVLQFVCASSKNVCNEFIRFAMRRGQIQSLSSDSYLIRKDGTEVPVADSAAPLMNDEGKVIGCVIVFRDVTKERAIDRAKTEFVSIASHQLRTPLSTIKWYAEMLLDGDVGKLSKNQKLYMNEIYTGNQQMIGLVNNLLNISRIDMGTFPVRPENVNMVEIADQILFHLRSKIFEKKMNLRKIFHRDVPRVHADPQLVRIVLENLFSNAVKYNKREGDISIFIDAVLPGQIIGNRQIERAGVVIMVSDTGYGIPENQKSQIFTKFFRADNVIDRETEGNGLGLYIVKSIIDYSSGDIWFRSNVDIGTIFCVLFPLKGKTSKQKPAK